VRKSLARDLHEVFLSCRAETLMEVSKQHLRYAKFHSKTESELQNYVIVKYGAYSTCERDFAHANTQYLLKSNNCQVCPFLHKL